MSGGIEVAQDLRVYIYSKLLLFNELLVTSLHLLEDPITEGFANDRVCDVDDPLPGKTLVLILMRQVLDHLRVLLSLSHDLLDAEALVLGE